MRLDAPAERTIARRFWIAGSAAILVGLNWIGGCQSDGPLDPKVTRHGSVVISDPTSNGSGTSALAPGSRFVYVSLVAGTIDNGRYATVRNLRTGRTVTASLVAGGFDPVQVPARAGDTLELEVTRLGAGRWRRSSTVPRARSPIVLRTYPASGDRALALNSGIQVVFSEPVAAGTLTPSTVQLLRGTSPVAGTVGPLPGTTTAALFVPAALLAANTDYQLIVRQGVRDLEGGALAADITVDFTTGHVVTGPPAWLSLFPDTIVSMTGPIFQMTAVVQDPPGNPLFDQPVTWSSSDPRGLAVDPTGLMSALLSGTYVVTASLGRLQASTSVSVKLPAASVTLAPTPASVTASDTIVLAATVRNAAGTVFDHPSVTWTSSNPAAATAASYNAGDTPGLRFGTVTGVSPGSVTITATSGPASVTATVTVGPPASVAAVTVTPASPTLVLGGTVQLTPTLQDANGKVLFPRPATWASDNPSVVIVGPTGVVKAVGAGSATVTATREGVSGTAAVTVDLAMLVFESEPNGNHEIYVINRDGSGQANLTNNAATDVKPQWSPDGQKIAFVSFRGQFGTSEIYIMNADGSAVARLTHNTANDADPVWSPDGQKITFESSRDGNWEIYVINADGSGQTRLTNNAAIDFDPHWSADGQKLAFVSDRDGNAEIYVMNADGSAQTRLTNHPEIDNQPSWSPDGLQIAFVSASTGNGDIHLVAADGSGEKNLSNNGMDNFDPEWSPDGQKIAFWSNSDGQIYVMNPDGSAQIALTNNGGVTPRWSPDGQRIAFHSYRDGNLEIYIMNPDGSAQTRLTNNAAVDLSPRWRP